MAVHWLDRLALTAARGMGTVEGNSDRDASTDDGLSREAAVKLGLAGLASISFGLWSAPRGSAQGNPGLTPEASKCFAGCALNWQKNQDANRATCDDIIGKDIDDVKGAWAKLKVALPFPGVALAKYVLKGYCYQFADQKARGKWRDCNDECADNCARAARRNPQGTSAARQACEAPPPPKPYTPVPPPPPNMTEDPCWSCVQVGGQCCGPFKGDPATGQFQPCACANPSIGCEYYGCG